jgi:serine/threonine protein kinase
MEITRRSLMKHRFHKVKRIGEGTFGSALLALDIECGQLCVIKRLKHRPRKPKEIQAALNEIATLSRLHHPNIVDFSDSWIEEDGHLHLAMEYCDGGDLMQYLESHTNEPLPEATIRSFMAQLLLGTEHMHRHHVIHRDIKLQNIFMSHNRTILKIGDFGLSKLINSTDEAAKTQAGTPFYFSPEIASGSDHTRKTDIWSLGVMLYYMLCRELPFKGSGLRGILESICNANPEPIDIASAKRFGAAYSPEVCDAVAQMLIKDPTQRPSAAELLQLPWLQELVAASPWTDAIVSAPKNPYHRPAMMKLTRPRVTINIRAEPTLDSSILGTLALDDVICVLGEIQLPNNSRTSIAAAGVPNCPSAIRWYRLSSPVFGWCIADLNAAPLFEVIKTAVTARKPSPHPVAPVGTPRTPGSSPPRRPSTAAVSPLKRESSLVRGSPPRQVNPTPAQPEPVFRKMSPFSRGLPEPSRRVTASPVRQTPVVVLPSTGRMYLSPLRRLERR